MSPIKKIFGVEWRHIFALSPRVRGLLWSYSLREASAPILDIFVNAFLWRAHQDASLIAIYNLGLFLGIPLGFLLNGVFLKDRLKTTHLYAIGAVSKGLMVGLLIFLSPGSWQSIMATGVLFGITNGIYWANRNFLTLEYIHDKNSNYFFGLNGAIASITGVIIPALAGWLIAATATGYYNADTAYRLLMLLAIILLFCSGRAIYKKNYPVPRVQAILMRHADRFWNGVRCTSVLVGFLSGTHIFLPVIMILAFVGDEGALGAIRSVVTLATAAILYFVGSRTPPGGRAKVMAWGVFFIIVSAGAFAIFNQPTTALLYVIVSSLGVSLINTAYAPFVVFATEADTKNDRSSHYARVVDHEIFLNGGRIAGAGIFLILATYLNLETSLRIILPAMAGLQIGLVLLTQRLIKKGQMPRHAGAKEHILAKVRKAPAES